MRFTVRSELKLALLLLFILAVYFPSITHPFSRFDDPFIIEFYGTNNTLSFLNVISPGAGFYFRPLVNLSYWLDSLLWGLDSTFMHLENIVAHLANVFLVFLIASRLPAVSEIKGLPYFCALLFGLHPINSESVNWIAGRTDLFAGVFILCAVYCLIRAIQEQSTRFAMVAYFVSFLGILTKETAIMFLPTALLIAFFWPVVAADVSRYRTWRTRFLIVPIVISSCFVFFLLLMLYVKGQGNNAITLVLENGPTNLITGSIEAFGFYVKKILLPLPLNMAIVEVDPLYAIAGIISLSLLAVTYRRCGIPGIFLATSVLFILPAMIVAATSFTWVPFGERYLYIPSAFAVIGCLELSHRFMVRWNAVTWYGLFVSIIILMAATATFQRGMLWGDNLEMLEDIVAQSPGFGVARGEYGVLLKLAGRYDEAEKQFIIASQQQNKQNINRIIHLNLIGMKIREKSHDEARIILLSEIGNKADGDVELLKLLNKYDETMLQETVPLKKRKKIVADIIETNQSLYIKTKEPFYLYRSGQLALQIGNKQDAANYFRTAWEKAPADSYYREPARRLAEQLGAK